MVNTMKYLVLLVILFLSIVIGPATAEPIINETNSSKYLDYGPNHYYTLQIKGLLLNKTYILMVSNNTADRYNITFSTLAPTCNIDITYEGTLFDSYNTSITQLQIMLTDLQNTLYFTWYIDLKFNNLGTLVDYIIDKLFLAVYFFLSGIAVIVAIVFMKHVWS